MDLNIVPATEQSLNEIEAWLVAEEAAYDAAEARQMNEGWDTEVEMPVRGFLCNWNLVTRSFAECPDNVQVLMVDGAAVGFIDTMDFLEVRPDLRGKGYGRVLAEFMLRRAFDRGYSVAEIAIAPQSALPFWLSMGFTADLNRPGRGGGVYAFKRFTRTKALGDGPRTAYRVAFYPPDRDWAEVTKPFHVFEGLGEAQRDGGVQLPERAYCFDAARSTSIDCFVQIELAGECLFEGKVKRPEARNYGLQLDPSYTYFVDVIRTGSAPGR